MSKQCIMCGKDVPKTRRKYCGDRCMLLHDNRQKYVYVMQRYRYKKSIIDSMTPEEQHAEMMKVYYDMEKKTVN